MQLFWYRSFLYFWCIFLQKYKLKSSSKTHMCKHLSSKNIFSLLLLAIGLLSCNNKSTEKQDHLVFRYNENANISSLDPAFTRNLPNIWPSLQMYNGLVQFDESLNLKPDIATHWEFIEDRKSTR